METRLLEAKARSEVALIQMSANMNHLHDKDDRPSAHQSIATAELETTRFQLSATRTEAPKINSQSTEQNMLKKRPNRKRWMFRTNGTTMRKN